MEIYDIIEAAGSYLKEGTLVLYRSMKVHPKFKVYKSFCYNLYYVKDKENTLLFSKEDTVKAADDEINKTWDKYDKLYVRDLIKWFTSNEYKSMLKDGIQ